MPDAAARAETLGRIVRDIWRAWAQEQSDPKLSWLLPWDQLTEPEREVDRRIGCELFDRGFRAGVEAAARAVEGYSFVTDSAGIGQEPSSEEWQTVEPVVWYLAAAIRALEMPR
jgi:hypothetical protein